MNPRSFLCLVLVCVFWGCSEPPVDKPSNMVDSQQVETILLASNAEQQRVCAKEIKSQNAEVLYLGPTGTLFTNKKPSELRLNNCLAPLSPNSRLILSERRKFSSESMEPQPDLPTLLKLIPAEKIGARSFVSNFPSYDGRGIVIAVLDTGLEVDHPMLQKNSLGEHKILSNQDFSGEGLVNLAPVTVTKDGSFVTPEGVSYQTGNLAASDFHFGVFQGSSLLYAGGLSGKDTFRDLGTLTYMSQQGMRRGKVDADDDKSFEDEEELYDFRGSRKFIRLGDKQTLPAVMNIAPEGTKATLVFDDGGHGTHVAGIAAGFEPKGLTGVAPGAKVIGAKIGDNRLSGGSTTTASMILAIDFAVSEGAHIINLSYGIKPGSNIGKSTIDQYVDKIAREQGVLFSISAGNEGPGLLSVGTPAGAELAFSNAALLPKDTAQINYGFVSVKEDLLWFFSSVGPQLDGGWRPTLLAPGTALSSVPAFLEGHANWSGTSMASPQVTGGLALLLSAAQQESLATDRVSITHAVCQSAQKIPSLALVEQGHGLMDVPAAHELLKKTSHIFPVEYSILVNSPTAPLGIGKGIYTRSRNLPANLFTVYITPRFPSAANDSQKNVLKTFRLVPSASWIHTPSHFFIMGSTRTFQVDLESSVLNHAGLHSEKISAINEENGMVAFEVPVTVVAPYILDHGNQNEFNSKIEVGVGHTKRIFLDVPPGTTSVQLDLDSSGPMIWGQLLDAEGRVVLDLLPKDMLSPQPPLLSQVNITRPGVYELDIIAPASNAKPATVKLWVKAFGISVQKGPYKSKNSLDIIIENQFEPIKLKPSVLLPCASKDSFLETEADNVEVPFSLSKSDIDTLSKVEFIVRTSLELYDQMTDFPYWILDSQKSMVASGGLELESTINMDLSQSKKEEEYVLKVMPAFTKKKPSSWGLEMIEKRCLKSPLSLLSGVTTLFERGQRKYIPLDLSLHKEPIIKGMKNCFVLKLLTPGDRLIQEDTICQQ